MKNKHICLEAAYFVRAGMVPNAVSSLVYLRDAEVILHKYAAFGMSEGEGRASAKTESSLTRRGKQTSDKRQIGLSSWRI